MLFVLDMIGKSDPHYAWHFQVHFEQNTTTETVEGTKKRPKPTRKELQRPQPKIIGKHAHNINGLFLNHYIFTIGVVLLIKLSQREHMQARPN